MRPIALPPLIAHRGAPQVAPENTLAALYHAKTLGAQWVEFDVCLTQDDQPVVIHDTTLDRTTNGQGLVAETAYAKITTLDAGSWFDPAFKNERVPSLADYLRTAAELGLGINVELKPTKKSEAVLAKQVIEHLKKYWLATLPRPLISSSSDVCLEAVRQYSSDYLMGYILHIWSWSWQRRLEALSCVSIHLPYSALNIKKIHQIKKAGYLLLAYTVNELSIARNLLAAGVDSLFTDDITLGI